jgi:phosphomannomutase
VRPSGTEPKLKYYIDHREPIGAEESQSAAEERARAVIAALDTEIAALLHAAA